MEVCDLSKLRTLDKVMSVHSKEIGKICPLVDELYRWEFIRLEDGLYHVKNKELKFLVNELIGEKVSEFFGLSTVKSFLASADFLMRSINPVVLVSKAFFEDGIKYGDVMDFPEMKFYSGVGLDNLSCLSTYYDKDIGKRIRLTRTSLKRLLLDIKKLIVRDFLTLQNDRNMSNMMFGFRSRSAKLLPVFDYEHSFGKYYSIHMGIFDCDLELTKVRKVVTSDEDFRMLFHRLMEFEIDAVLNEVEEEHGILIDDMEKDNYRQVVNGQKNLVLCNRILR